jgi:WhiB family transcriptional regulator, redox-sensing transcriptional regulator
MRAAWMARARCAGAPLAQFVPDDEQPKPPADVLAYCAPCPVAGDCLDWALEYREVGYWGGTSTHQRRQLKRPRQRVACPKCRGVLVVPVAGAQVCVPCAVSWRAA